MKKTILTFPIFSSLIILFFNIGCNKTLTDKNRILEEIKIRSDSLVMAESALDAENAIKFFAEDAIVQPSNSPQINGKESIDEMYSQFFNLEGIKESTFYYCRKKLAKQGRIKNFIPLVKRCA